MIKRLLVDPEREALPSRVRETIRAQQDRSEILIGWAQLAVVGTFGALYLLAPKTFSADMTFAPVPWALSIYIGLTVVRLIWGSQARLPTWSLMVSVLFDMALLMVLIWSFHLQYGQPATFYLKAPTVMYIFIFIALRALRFEASMVLWSGLVAACGWGLMILYAILADPFDTMITRDYVEYLTSNSVLLGAEFDKIITILAVTIIIAVALQRAKGLLVSAVKEQTAAQELSRFFSPEVAERIRGSDQEIMAGYGEQRDAAILNIDMRGFTRYAGEHTPTETMNLLAEYQARMVPIIRRNGGIVDKFLGDGIMASFGAAKPSQSYAADALRALEEVIDEGVNWRRQRLAKDQQCPDVNAAVASGPVIFGAVGDQSRLEYTVIGDAVNLSAKLEKHNSVTRVKALVDAETYALAGEQGYAPNEKKQHLSAVEVGNVGHPLDLVVIAA